MYVENVSFMLLVVPVYGECASLRRQLSTYMLTVHPCCRSLSSCVLERAFFFLHASSPLFVPTLDVYPIVLHRTHLTLLCMTSARDGMFGGKQCVVLYIIFE